MKHLIPMLMLMAVSSSAFAASYYWRGSAGSELDWSAQTGGNTYWNTKRDGTGTFGTPGSSDRAYVESDGSTGERTVIISGAVGPISQLLINTSNAYTTPSTVRVADGGWFKGGAIIVSGVSGNYGSNGKLEVTGGRLDDVGSGARGFAIGCGKNSTGRFEMSGGTLVMAAGTRASGGQYGLNVGTKLDSSQNAKGYLDLQGGTIDASGVSTVVGYSGNSMYGYVTQSGGSFLLKDVTLYSGSTWTMTGGNLTAGQIDVSGSFVVRGGTADVSGVTNLTVAADTGSVLFSCYTGGVRKVTADRLGQAVIDRSAITYDADASVKSTALLFSNSTITVGGKYSLAGQTEIQLVESSLQVGEALQLTGDSSYPTNRLVLDGVTASVGGDIVLYNRLGNFNSIVISGGTVEAEGSLYAKTPNASNQPERCARIEVLDGGLICTNGYIYNQGANPLELVVKGRSRVWTQGFTKYEGAYRPFLIEYVLDRTGLNPICFTKHADDKAAAYGNFRLRPEGGLQLVHTNAWPLLRRVEGITLPETGPIQSVPDENLWMTGSLVPASDWGSRLNPSAELAAFTQSGQSVTLSAPKPFGFLTLPRINTNGLNAVTLRLKLNAEAKSVAEVIEDMARAGYEATSTSGADGMNVQVVMPRDSFVSKSSGEKILLDFTETPGYRRGESGMAIAAPVTNATVSAASLSIDRQASGLMLLVR